MKLDTAGPHPPLSFHPLAAIFPLAAEARLQALANDIAACGQLDEITLHEGKILDGRCRYLACQRVGVTPKFENYVGGDPLGLIIGRHLHRRQLTKGERVFAAARAATLPVGANQTSEGLPIGTAAKLFQVSARSIARAKSILRHGTAELVCAVEVGKVTLYDAAKLCELAPDMQTATVNKILEGKRHGQKRKSPGVGRKNRSETSDSARPCEHSPDASSQRACDSERDTIDAARNDEAAYNKLVGDWDLASNPARIKFLEFLTSNWRKWGIEG